MADSTTNQDLISSGQAQKEVSMNAFIDAASKATLYGRRATTTTALTWGFFGGKLGGVSTKIANGTVALTASATNYIEADKSTGAVSVNTTAFTSGKIPLYKVVTGTATVTSYEDWRDEVMYSSGNVADSITNGVTDVAPSQNAVFDALVLKQDTLVSGTNIKTINGTSILGSGDIAVGGGGGLTYLQELKNITDPNATVPIISLNPNASNTETNIDLVIAPKGNGSFASQIADGTITNGNKRGTYSVDFQRERTEANQVASGIRCFNFGANNLISANYSFSFGDTNSVTGAGSNIVFGINNLVTNTTDTSILSNKPCLIIGNSNYHSFSVYGSGANGSYMIGDSNRIVGSSDYIFGRSNKVNNNDNFIVGYNNGNQTASGYSNLILGFQNNYYSTNSGFYNITLIGKGNEVKTNNIGGSLSLGNNNSIYASNSNVFGYFGSDKGVNNCFIFGNNITQQGKYILFKTTTAVSGTFSLSADGAAISASNIPTLQNNEVRTFTGTIVAKDTGNTGVVAGWKVEGVIMRLANAGTTSFVGTPTITQLGATASATSNGYSVAVVANTTIGGLEVQFTQTGAIETRIATNINMIEL